MHYSDLSHEGRCIFRQSMCPNHNDNIVIDRLFVFYFQIKSGLSVE